MSRPPKVRPGKSKLKGFFCMTKDSFEFKLMVVKSYLKGDRGK